MKIFEKNGLLFIFGGFYLNSFSTEKSLPPKERIKIINEEILAHNTENKDIYDLFTRIKIKNDSICYVKSAEINRLAAVFNEKLKLNGYGSFSFYIAACLKQLQKNLEFEKDLSNTITCFQINNDEYGYIYIRDGTIYNKESEQIADKETIKKSIDLLIREYQHTAYKIRAVLGTSEFDEIKEILLSGTKFVPLGYDKENKEYLKNSEEIFWNKKQLKNFSKIKFRQALDPKKVIKNIVLISITALVASIIISIFAQPAIRYTKNIFGQHQNNTHKTIAPPHTGYLNSNELIKACFNNMDNIFALNSSYSKYGWYIKNFECNSKSIIIKFDSSENIPIPELGLIELRSIISKDIIVIKIPNAKSDYVYRKKLMLNDNYRYRGDAIKLLEDLDNEAAELGITITFNNDGNIHLFEIKSDFSPLFLLNVGYLSNIPLKGISGSYNKNSSIYQWTIKGGA